VVVLSHSFRDRDHDMPTSVIGRVKQTIAERFSLEG
jgi:hypothetical protein